MRLILVGPSHIPRIRHALEVVGLPKPAKEILYLGDGGFPIWKKSVFEQCCNEFREGDRILLIAADFRFGNSILNDKDCKIDDEFFFDNHTHVNRELCTLENDKILKTLCINSLQKWKERFGKSITILHWTLALRTVKNRISKQHSNTENSYLHPVWNIDEPVFSDEVPGLGKLQHSNDLSTCNNLTIDNDLHPSTLGYLYICANTALANHDESLAKAKSIYMAGINALSATLTNSPFPKCLIFGTSKSLATLLTALPLSTQNLLSRAGLDILPPEKKPELQQLKKYENLIYLSSTPIKEPRTINDETAKINTELGTHQQKVTILFWESLATQVMQWRARNQRNLGTGLIEKKLAAELYNTFWKQANSDFNFEKADKLIEHGAGGYCTLWGVLTILAAATGLSPTPTAESVLNHMKNSAITHNIISN